MKPFTAIYLDRVYRLRLTIGAIAEYEQLNEKPLGAGMDTEDMLCLAWIMMRQDASALRLEDAVGLTAADGETVFKAVRNAIDASITKSEKQTPGEPEFYDIDRALKLAVDVGITPAALVDLTPAEFDALCDAHIKRRKIERNDQTRQAYMTAYFNRVDKMPELSKFLEDTERHAAPAREMTTEEMLGACRAICAAFGGKVVET